FIPAVWHDYAPTFWDFSLYIGTIGMFLTFIFLFIRVLPVISTFEMRELLARTEQAEEDTGDGAGGLHTVPEAGAAD
ncbi:MAG: hydrogenase, partial [Anaerolineae bacterium]|nr:hydrogenase [Anaerolineae bacterium]